MMRTNAGIIAIMLAVSAAGALAADRTWTNGGGDNDWFNPANWDAAGDPAPSDALSVLSGTPGTTAGVSADEGGSISVIGSEASASLGMLRIGAASTGWLNVTAEGHLSDTYGIIGQGLGSYGAATVDGQFSRWDSTQEFYVGYAGNGTLNVVNGGTVISPFVTLGMGASSVGSAVVDGQVSNINADEMLTLGLSGYGTLSVRNDGIINSGSTMLGAAYGGYGLATLESGGHMDVNGMLYVGLNGTGELNVASGGSLQTEGAAVGHSNGATGRVEIAGTYPDGVEPSVTSYWDNNGTLYVGGGDSGYAGHGELAVGDFGEVRTDRMEIGSTIGSTGAVAVSRYGNLQCRDETIVGNAGSGELNFTSRGLYAPTSFGSQLVIGAQAGSVGVMNFDGMDRDGTGFSAGHIIVGAGGQGTLNITGADTVHSDWTVVGRDAGAVGEIVVEGGVFGPSDGSYPATVGGSEQIDPEEERWGLRLGDYGTGTLTLRNATMHVSAYPPYSEFTLGAHNGSHGTLILDGPNAVLDVDSNRLQPLVIGGTRGGAVGGHGTLILQNGAQWDTDYSFTIRGVSLGYSAGSHGEVIVDGAGFEVPISQWTANKIYLGGGEEWYDPELGQVLPGPGRGTLTLRNGGRVAADQLILGAVPGAEGTVVFDGTFGDSWDSWSRRELLVEEVIVGQAGHGTIALRNGAVWELPEDNQYQQIIFAPNAGSRASIVAEGAGSRCRISANYQTGERSISAQGAVELVAREGGGFTMSEGTFILGAETHNNDSLTVTGLGSYWDGSSQWGDSNLVVGQRGRAEVKVLDAGMLGADNIELAVEPGSQAKVSVSGALITYPPHPDGSDGVKAAPSSIFADNLVVGRGGNAELIIAEGRCGHVRATRCSVAAEPGSVGMIAIDPNDLFNWEQGDLNADMMAIGGAIDAQGQVTAGGQAMVTIGSWGGMTIDSQLHILPGGRLENQEGGILRIGFGPSTVGLNGELHLGGTIIGNIGNMAGLMEVVGDEAIIDGDYHQGDGRVYLGGGKLFETVGQIAFELGSAESGDFDHLTVTEDAVLGGRLFVEVNGNRYGGQPWIGDVIEILTAGNVDGEFDELVVTGGEVDFDILYTDTAVLLEVTRISPLLTREYGDFTGDGVVDTSDYTIWCDSFGQTGPELAADSNADGVVDQLDYVCWADCFGNVLTNPATVPEPATLGLLAVAGLALLRRRR